MNVQPCVRLSIQAIYDRAKADINKEIIRHGGTREKVLAVRHLEAIDRILDATSVSEAEALAKKARLKVDATCLALRMHHKITPKTPEEYFKKAKRADSLADMLWKQYIEFKPLDDEDVEKRAKLLFRHTEKKDLAAKLRQYAHQLAENPELPSFEELYPKEKVEDEEEPEEQKPKKPRAKKVKGRKPTRRKKTA